MGPETPVWIQTVSVVAQSCIAIAAFLLSLVLWIITRRQARVEYTRSIQESWNALNLSILSNPKLAPIADSLFQFPTGPSTEEAHLKRYLGFLCLNVLEAAYIGHNAGLVERSYHFESIAHILTPLLSDPEIAKLVQVGGYHSEFVKFCENRRRANLARPSSREA